ncbi:MAG TPA: hypothetical protein VJR69_13740 [Nitrospira sp.]|nr:hypothetical protein [Nitrospira sp.]
MNTQWFVAYLMMAVLWQVAPVFSQEAILPQGDPRLREQSTDKHQDAAESRLKQQGQGPNYRVQGKPQGGTGGTTAGAPNGLSRQETGMDDPTVNPGQASGMRVLRGEVKQAGIKTIVIEDRNGKQVTMSIDPATAGDRDIRPGDVITGTVTAQGRAVTIHKEASAKAESDISMSDGKGGGHGDISPQQAGKKNGEPSGRP